MKDIEGYEPGLKAFIGNVLHCRGDQGVCEDELDVMEAWFKEQYVSHMILKAICDGEICIRWDEGATEPKLWRHGERSKQDQLQRFVRKFKDAV